MTTLAFIPKGEILKLYKEISKRNIDKNLNSKIQTNQEIIGTWINEEDTSYKLVFLDTGVLNEYVNNVLMGTLTYTISHSCGLTSDPNYEFLEKIESDGATYCYEINGINVDNSGILSIRSMENGKLYIFNKVTN